MPTQTKYTREELEFREQLSGKLATIEGKIDTLHETLKPVIALQEIVTQHDRQIARWQGVNAVLGFIAASGIALYAKFRHWM